jgi:hypothetical protein
LQFRLPDLLAHPFLILICGGVLFHCLEILSSVWWIAIAVEDWEAMVVESCVLGLRQLGQINPLEKMAQVLNPK